VEGEGVKGGPPPSAPPRICLYIRPQLLAGYIFSIFRKNSKATAFIPIEGTVFLHLQFLTRVNKLLLYFCKQLSM
jgi:hypothetical protein